ATRGDCATRGGRSANRYRPDVRSASHDDQPIAGPMIGQGARTTAKLSPFAPLRQKATSRRSHYLDHTATVVAIVVAIVLTDHLFSPIGITVKQLAFAWAQLVQKPCALSLHVPALLLPDSARGSRIIFPSGVKVILNLAPLGEAAVKGSPLKNVAWMSLGAMGSAAKALLTWKSIVATRNGSARIEARGDGQPRTSGSANIHAITRSRVSGETPPRF